MKTKTVVIIGGGHLAYRVKKSVTAKGHQVTHITGLLPQGKEAHLSTINAVPKLCGTLIFL